MIRKNWNLKGNIFDVLSSHYSVLIHWSTGSLRHIALSTFIKVLNTSIFVLVNLYFSLTWREWGRAVHLWSDYKCLPLYGQINSNYIQISKHCRFWWQAVRRTSSKNKQPYQTSTIHWLPNEIQSRPKSHLMASNVNGLSETGVPSDPASNERPSRNLHILKFMLERLV